MIERILGIDLGIASLGWAVIEYDTAHDENNKIVDCGVRLFTAAETPKEKESPNKARREARGIRRVIKRRRVRMNKIKKLCISNGLLNANDFDLDDGIYNSKANRTDVWKLRHDALYRTLSGSELARVMIHIAKHRGYDFQTEDGDAGKVKTAGEELKKKFAEAGCRSIGEYIWLHPYISNERTIRRNKKDDYTISIHRDLLKAEIDEIFLTQIKLGNLKATDTLKEEYENIAFYVRPMQSIEGMVGYCTFFTDEKRAPKSSPTAEKFVALGKFFSTIIVDNQGNERKIIELKNVDELMQFAISKESLSYKQLRDFLELKNDFSIIFKGLSYKSKKSEATEWEKIIKETETKPWISLKGHTAFKAALGDEKFSNLLENIDLADEVAKALTYYKDERQKREELSKLKQLDADAIESLCKIGFTDFNQLSIKAMRIINHIMIEGYQRYDEAVRYALDQGLLPPKKDQKSEYLPPLKDTDIDILNPTVIRAFAQFRKVANALVKKYGSFDKVHFELAREVNTKADIDGMKEGQRKNEKEREAAKVWISENFGSSVPMTRKNILKKRLYEQQDGRCVYTGEVIHLERLFDEGYCEIDHILPRSRSADDSFANKVLVLTKANQDKTNRTPYEWFGDNVSAWDHYEARINSTTNRSKMGMGKINRLLKKNFDENSEKEFLSRNLNDTRYMARAIKTYCENYWKLSHEDDKLRIQIRSGKLTSELRSRWIEGYMKDRSIHTHHALDAIVIAFATQSMVQKLSTYYGAKETRRAKEKPIFKTPMEHFREVVDKALSLERAEVISAKDGREIELHRLIISRPPRASVTGQAHEQTAKPYPRIKDVKNKYKRRLIPIDEDKFEVFKNDKISSGNDKNFYNASTIPRVDIYKKGDKFHVVPIYLSDMAEEVLPNKSLGTNPEILDEKYFCFSVYKDDIIEIETKATPKKPAKKVMGYFGQLHGANFVLNSIDNAPIDGFICSPITLEKKQKEMCKKCPDENRLIGNCPNETLEFWKIENIKVPKKDFDCDQGIKFAVAVRKYTIDPLGYYHEVKGEKRLGTIPQERKKRGSQER